MPARRHYELLFKLAVNRAGGSQQNIVDELRRVILDGAVPVLPAGHARTMAVDGPSTRRRSHPRRRRQGSRAGLIDPAFPGA